MVADADRTIIEGDLQLVTQAAFTLASSAGGLISGTVDPGVSS